ncbi:hypothetical protein ABC977_04840 [Thioalkalicoccus limnaeus]|uniref:Uncharacterized protein n=1 Tax=Thioalkalicoccus limnaeus TaxID=120681 RepID=A0ABV4BB79_9GAMM
MRALLFKEWIKLRPWLALLVVGHLTFAVWFFLSMRQEFRVEHAEIIFHQASRIGRLFYDDLRYVPLVTGALLGVAQFLPEVSRGRLRLAMHLPVPLGALMAGHLALGLAALLVLLAFDLGALAVTVGVFFPAPFVASAVATALPWMLAGVAAYLGAALVLLEPVRWRQALNLVVVGGVIWLCHLSNAYGAYDLALPGLVLLTVLIAPAALLAAARFRDGAVS